MGLRKVIPSITPSSAELGNPDIKKVVKKKSSIFTSVNSEFTVHLHPGYTDLQFNEVGLKEPVKCMRCVLIETLSVKSQQRCDREDFTCDVTAHI